jgi:hypothetical protein
MPALRPVPRRESCALKSCQSIALVHHPVFSASHPTLICSVIPPYTSHPTQSHRWLQAPGAAPRHHEGRRARSHPHPPATPSTPPPTATARADSIGAVYLKKLSQALEDGDPIRGIIRRSAVNSNGHINGITLPRFDGQEASARPTPRPGWPTGTTGRTTSSATARAHPYPT